MGPKQDTDVQMIEQYLELQGMGIEKARRGRGRASSSSRPVLLKHSLPFIILVHTSVLHKTLAIETKGDRLFC